jgi:hypothetical protein
MGIRLNIGDFGGALAGAISKDLRAQREEKEAKNKAKLEDHSQAINLIEKKVKPVLIKDLQVKAKTITREFDALKIPISKTTVFKIATEGYKDFQEIIRDDPTRLKQFAGSASEDPSFNLQQAIELAAEEKATATMKPFMPPEQKSFLGFKTRIGERDIEKEAERLGMTAEEYKEYGSGTVPVPQVDVSLDTTVLSKVTPTQKLDRITINLFNELAKPKEEQDAKYIAKLSQERSSIIGLSTAKTRPTSSDIARSMNKAIDILETGVLSSSKYSKVVADPSNPRQTIRLFNVGNKNEAQLIMNMYEEAIRGYVDLTIGIEGSPKKRGTILEDLTKAAAIDPTFEPYKNYFQINRYVTPNPNRVLSIGKTGPIDFKADIQGQSVTGKNILRYQGN